MLYCFSAAFHPEKGSYAFTYGVSTRDLNAVNVRYFHNRGWKKIAMFSSTAAPRNTGVAISTFGGATR